MYFEDWQITLYHMVELLTIQGPVRDPYLSELSERYDLDSGCSVESTLPPHLAVVFAAYTRLRNKLVSGVGCEPLRLH